MMNRKEFYEYVKDNVKDYLPDSYQNGEIRIEEVAKNTEVDIPSGMIDNEIEAMIRDMPLRTLVTFTNVPDITRAKMSEMVENLNEMLAEK